MFFLLFMKLLKLGVVLLFVIPATILALANTNNKDFSNDIIIEDCLKISQEKVCVDNFGNKTCIKNPQV